MTTIINMWQIHWSFKDARKAPYYSGWIADPVIAARCYKEQAARTNEFAEVWVEEREVVIGEARRVAPESIGQRIGN